MPWTRKNSTRPSDIENYHQDHDISMDPLRSAISSRVRHFPISSWWFGTWILFSISYMGCHPSHWLIFFRGVGIPPTSIYLAAKFMEVFFLWSGDGKVLEYEWISRWQKFIEGLPETGNDKPADFTKELPSIMSAMTWKTNMHRSLMMLGWLVNGVSWRVSWWFQPTYRCFLG